MKNSIIFVKPSLFDVKTIALLLTNDVENGNILHRSNDEIASTIRSYILAKRDNEIIGFVALHIHTDELAEVRSLFVTHDNRDIGIGTSLVKEAIKEAKILNIKKILVLTYNESIYLNLKFRVIDKNTLPEHKIWADCIKCKHFPVCNEISLIKEI